MCHYNAMINPKSGDTIGQGRHAPAAKQGQVLERQPDLQSQPTKRMPHLAGEQPQNFSQKFLLARQGQLLSQPPTQEQGVYAGQGFPESCLARLCTTCARTAKRSCHVSPGAFI